MLQWASIVFRDPNAERLCDLPLPEITSAELADHRLQKGSNTAELLRDH